LRGDEIQPDGAQNTLRIQHFQNSPLAELIGGLGDADGFFGFP
jgi:hypothetical protein